MQEDFNLDLDLYVDYEPTLADDIKEVELLEFENDLDDYDLIP